MKKEEKSVSTNRFNRLFKIGSTIAKSGSQIALDYVSDKIKEKGSDIVNKASDTIEQTQDWHRKMKAVQEIIESMGELKGGLMKIGQMLSTTEDLIFPKEISQLFASLQKQAPPMTSEDIDKVFMKEFKKKPEQLFKKFSRKPFAAASIGQVHRATTKKGEEVAVKIQYYGIEKAVKNDLKNLDQIETLFSLLLKTKKTSIRPYLEEIKKSLLEECNYKIEAKNIQRFKRLYEKEFDTIYAPMVYEELSTRHILTTEYLEGDSFEDTLNYSEERKQKLAKIMYDSFLFGFYKAKYLHTDPHNGNFIFQKDRICVVDFGSTRKFDKSFIKDFAIMICSIERDDQEMFEIAARSLDIIQDNYKKTEAKKVYDLVYDIYSPYIKSGIYRVDKMNPFKLVKDFFFTFDIKRKKAPKEEFFLLDRAHIGLFTKVKSWDVALNWEEGRTKYFRPEAKKLFKEFNIDIDPYELDF